MELSPLCKICGKDLSKTVECAWTSCPLLFIETAEEKRMNIIGQNGNEGIHYENSSNT